MRMGWRARLGLFRTPDKLDACTLNFDQLFLSVEPKLTRNDHHFHLIVLINQINITVQATH